MAASCASAAPSHDAILLPYIQTREIAAVDTDETPSRLFQRVFFSPYFFLPLQTSMLLLFFTLAAALRTHTFSRISRSFSRHVHASPRGYNIYMPDDYYVSLKKISDGISPCTMKNRVILRERIQIEILSSEKRNPPMHLEFLTIFTEENSNFFEKEIKFRAPGEFDFFKLKFRLRSQNCRMCFRFLFILILFITEKSNKYR